MSKRTNSCYLGYETGIVSHVLLSNSFINNESESNKEIRRIEPEWEIKFAESAKNILLIMD